MQRVMPWLILVMLAGCSTPTPPFDLSQGWSVTDRQRFYSGDQGSRIMKTTWLTALKQADGQPFLGDKLVRYGYLPNDVDPISPLPIGFTTNGAGENQAIGMTCAACHTREIEYGGKRHRIEGGPAIVDFESFLLDLRAAVNTVTTQPAAFDDFAATVLRENATPAGKAELKRDLDIWEKRFGTLIQKSVQEPRDRAGAPVWGPGRLDAVSMIFNRLAGLDIAPSGPNGVLERNISAADVPVRYPFLWNSPKQDKTQWPGFAPNGDKFLGLIRNVGEVYGVFADFHPTPNKSSVTKVDYVTTNSANINGLEKLEDQLVRLRPPAYPGEIRKPLAEEGKVLFGTSKENPGQCWDCHGERQGIRRVFNADTWDTPLRDAGTDSRQYQLLARMVDTGTMNGTSLFPIVKPLPPRALASETLGTAVILSIIQKKLRFAPGPVEPNQPALDGEAAVATIQAPNERSLREKILAQSDLAKGLTQKDPKAAPDRNEPFKYEARVLAGIWAAAPYLHNGSVPTLADLLEPAANRPASFKIGPAYDLKKVGLAAEQTRFEPVLQTTGCDKRASGNSRCGHEYGAKTMTPAQKEALLEYLKTL